MRVVRTLAVTGLACLLGACTDSADPMSVISPSADEASVSLAKKRRKVYGDIAVDPNVARISVADTLRLRIRGKAWGRDVVPDKLYFSSADASIASVDDKGVVVGRKAGRVLIRAWSESDWVNYDPDSLYVTVVASGKPAPAPSKPDDKANTTKPPKDGDSRPNTPNKPPKEGDSKSDTPSKPPVKEAPPTKTPAPTQPPKDAPPTKTPTPTQPPTQTPAPAPAPTPTTPPSTPAPLPPAPQPPPPPSGTPAPSAGFPNQPSGMYIMADRAFDSKASNNNDRGATGSDGWDGIEYKYGKFSIVADPSAPSGDGRVAQMYYPANHQSGTAPATVQTQVFRNAPRKLYVSIWAKISSNWVGNQSGTNKMFFVGASGGNNQFFLSAEGQGHGPLVPQIRLQGIEDPRARVVPNVAPGTQLTRGQWQRWEFVLTCNSGLNKNDGTIDFYLDGRHVTHVDNVNWTQTKHPTVACDFPIFHWSPTYGGGGASPGADQYLWFDRVFVSGR